MSDTSISTLCFAGGDIQDGSGDVEGGSDPGVSESNGQLSVSCQWGTMLATMNQGSFIS